MECPATPPNIADCEMLRTPSPSKHDELGTSHNKTAQNKSIHGTDEDDKDKKEGSDTQAKDDGRCRSPDPTCAICLGQIENMSYTDSCFHKFCFTCLLEWSKVSSNIKILQQFSECKPRMLLKDGN